MPSKIKESKRSHTNKSTPKRQKTPPGFYVARKKSEDGAPRRKVPQTYAAKAAWLVRHGKQTFDFKAIKRKSEFSPKQKAEITKRFHGVKAPVLDNKGNQKVTKEGKKMYARKGGLWQWRDEHLIKVRSKEMGEALERQGAHIVGGVAAIRRAQRLDKYYDRLSVDKTGKRTRRVGGTVITTFPVSDKFLSDLLNAEDETAEEMCGIKFKTFGPFKIESSSGFSSDLDAVQDLIDKLKSFAAKGLLSEVVGIATIRNVKARGKRVKKKKVRNV